MLGTQRPEKGIRAPETEFTVGREPLCGYWELNLELNPPPEEKPVLLTAVPSL